jgi:hypothetical protein
MKPKQRKKQAAKRNNSATTINDAGEGKAPPAVIKEVARDTLIWADAISEGKAIVARAEIDQMRLGELADEVEPKYGSKTLANFAVEIGVAACTLKRRRDVFRAWKEISAPARLSFSVRQELATHPKRAEIVAEHPDLTKREARALMSELRGNQKPKAPKDSAQDHDKRTLAELVSLATKAIGATEFVNQPLTPEARHDLRESIEPKLLETIRQGGEALVKAADFMQELSKQEEDWEGAAVPLAA